MSDKITVKDLYDCKISYIKPLIEGKAYPWEILPEIKSYVSALVNNGIEGFTELMPGVLVGKNVKIYPTATIEAPAVIGDNCEVRPGAFIRGSVVTGPDCVIGNSSELKNCVLMEHVQVPHYNYVGDSVLGNGAHMGAGSVCSNLKSDGKNVVIHGEKNYETGLRKIGSFLGDKADVGCGAILNPGTVVGKNTSVYPQTVLRGVYGEGMIVKSTDESVKRI